MKGYLKNPTATAEAFRGDWYHTGDLAVRHPDGYAEVKDRSKDIIISGGENISSLEVEEALYRHPAVMEAAVVAMPDERYGERPCAFVTLKEGAAADEAGDHRLVPRAPGPLQGAEPGGVRAAAQDLDRQDPEVRAARAREAGMTAMARREIVRAFFALRGASGSPCKLRRGRQAGSFVPILGIRSCRNGMADGASQQLARVRVFGRKVVRLDSAGREHAGSVRY